MKRSALQCLALVATWLACANGPARAQAAAPSAESATAGMAAPWHEPRAGLLTGGQPDAAAWAGLKARGVTTVVNLRPDAEMAGRNEAAEVAAAGMAYVATPVAGAADIDADHARRLWTLLKFSQGTVFVHCASGNRAGALLALGAAQSGDMPPEAALEFGRKAGLGSLEPVVRERLGLPPAR
jgi:uncharacterized protein (TIGR01244 family)